MVGQVLHDRYLIQEQLGKKSGRQTLLARDLQTEESVVIKLLRFDSDFEWDDLKLFQREAETLKALSHPAIPRYLDYFELDSPNGKGFALVQSYIEAKSLEEQLKAGRTFSEADVKEIAKSLLEILTYLHGRQPPVIHRDIKPSNILLTNRSGNSVGQIYLVDFGSVQTLAVREGSTITVVGTYGYMPPEQFGGRAFPASDLYSLGATLIYLVTGNHPADLPQKEFRIQFEHLVNIDPAFSSWLMRTIEPTLEKRFTSVQEALQALKHLPSGNISPAVITQLQQSKVLLTKDANSLEIIFPQEAKSSLIGRLSYYLPILLFLNLFMLFIPYDYSFYFQLLVNILGAAIGLICFHMASQCCIKICHKKVSVTYKLFGFKYYLTRPIPKQEIKKLQVKCFAFPRQVREIMICKICTSRSSYVIMNNVEITDSEFKQLVQEISNRLRIPITQINISNN